MAIAAIGPRSGPSVTAILKERQRNKEWASENRSCKKIRPWLAGTPPYGRYLPGGATSVLLDPLPYWPIELRNTRALHGAITTISREPHERWAKWSLIPWENSWVVYWLTPEGTSRAATRWLVPLFDVPTEFKFGPLVKFRTPIVERRGHQRVRVDAITPVVITNDGRTTSITHPTAETILNSICGEFLKKIAPSEEWASWVRERVFGTLLSRETQPACVPMGGKYGDVHGWTGSVTMDVNAPTRWLLHVAERIGLGSRTAFGFGRIRVNST